MISLPAALPAPSQEFSFGKESNSVRTTMESGATRQRRTSLFNSYKAEIKWELNPEEFDLFNQFMELEACGGVAWFEAPLYTGGVLMPHKIRLVNGVYNSAYQSWGGWVVTATVDIRQIQNNGEDFYWLAKQNEENFWLIANHLEKLVNVELPGIELN